MSNSPTLTDKRLMKTIKFPLLAAGMALSLSACHNGENEFPDFDYQTVYFAHQSAGRTIELGRDTEIDLTLDNNHQINVLAVMGGAYSNTKDRIINFSVAPELCEDLYFTSAYGGRKVLPLPENYYRIDRNSITIPKGKMDGGVTVTFTDDFFNDPLSLEFNYVLPLVMDNALGVDSILCGKAAVANPNRLVASDWSVQPKDYVLYCMRYVNPWHGIYLRRGSDRLTVDGTTKEITRSAGNVLKDEKVNLTTTAYRACEVELKTKSGETTYSYKLHLDFDDNGNCTVSSADSNVTATGTGRFVIDGEKKAINNEDRDALYLEYTVSGAGWKLETKDTMVIRNRGISASFPTFEVRH